MKTRDFEYSLPKALIAQSPIEPRDASKLLVLDRERRRVKEDIFRNIVDYLEPGDLLVLNDTKVIPARLFARKRTGGKVEVFLLKRLNATKWEALVRPGRRLPVGTELVLGEDVRLVVLERTEEGSRVIEFSSSKMVDLALAKYGKTPLPPYIKTPISDPERYQTIYAKEEGSVAAPTAALHFTPELLKRIEEKGVGVLYITLHMGWGSFRPIREEVLSAHRLPTEYYRIPEEVVKGVKEVKEKKRRIIACGTDVVRALEGASEDGVLRSGEGETSLFITPGYRFKIVDVLITNLHLPRSSHLVLVSAFANRDFILQAYQYAMDKGFRFYTFGDATIII
jgi:S-adenosylmethionine:tRNA ribosyltransferase-isomerase